MFSRKLLATVIIVPWLIVSVHADEPPRAAPLKYRLTHKPEDEVGRQSYPFFWDNNLLDELPDRIQGRQWKSPQPIFGWVRLGLPAEEFFIAVDSSSGTTTQYDVIYVDLDRNERFDNRERIEPGREPSTFGPFRIDVASRKQANGSIDRSPQWFTVQIYPSSLRVPAQMSSDLIGGFVQPAAVAEATQRSNRKRPDFVISLTNMGYYMGRVQFGDEKLLVGVSDANGDGVYSTNSFLLPRTGSQEEDQVGEADAEQNQNAARFGHSPDRLLIDRDSEGQFDDRRGPEPERMTLGRFIVVKGRLYSLDIASDGTSITVSPTDLPTATLEWTGSVGSLVLGLVRADNRRADVLHVSTSGESVTVPAGRYVVLQSNFTFKDTAGRDWQFYRMPGAPWTHSSILEVPAGSRAKLPLGPPIDARFIVSQPNPDTHTLTLILELKALDGQHVNPPPPVQRTPMPQARITDASGANELALLDCNPGRAGQWTAVWRIPDKPKGEFRVSAVLDRWSISSRSEPTAFQIDASGRLLSDKKQDE